MDTLTAESTHDQEQFTHAAGIVMRRYGLTLDPASVVELDLIGEWQRKSYLALYQADSSERAGQDPAMRIYFYRRPA